MTYLAPRTVSVVSPPDGDAAAERGGLPLTDFRSARSYVLLGEPGLGKTTAFRTEAEQAGGIFLTARELLRGNPAHHPEWRDRTLFVDGLDEMRAGAGDPRTPLDRVVAKLEALGSPPFRLACRTSSWLQPGDERALSSLTGSGTIRILTLNSLSRDAVSRLVSPRGNDAEEFMFDAFEHGLEAFLWNPQLLDVLLGAVDAGGWPDSPRTAFENACRELARERNPEHRDASRGGVQPSRDAVLLAAGRLSALLLLTEKQGWTATDTDDPDILSLRDVDDAVDGEDRDALLAALDSGLFAGVASARTPVHRLVAEFLGARYVDERVRAPQGTTVRRALSLLLGHDGIPLPDLRGLSAWIASLNPEARTILIRADPIAVAFGGDATNFTSGERRDLFTHLKNSPRLPLVWPSSAALGALAGGRDGSALWELISSPVRTDARQTLVARLLTGFARNLRVTTADRGPAPKPDDDLALQTLRRIIYDDDWRDDVRCEAIEALDLLFPDGGHRSSVLGSILSDVEAGRLADEDHELLGTLLSLMYPRDITPAEIWDHFAVGRRPGVTGYSQFWHNLPAGSSPELTRQLLDSLCDRADEVIPVLADDNFGTIVLELLAHGLELFGDEATEAELHRWFGVVDAAPNRSGLIPAHCGPFLPVDFFPDLSDRIHTWLRSRKPVQCALLELGLGEREDEVGSKALDQSIGRKLVGEEAPAGFRRWCLTRAAELADTRPKIAEELAWWAIRRRDGWGPPLSDRDVALTVRDVPMLREWNAKRLEARASWEREDAERRAQHAPVVNRVRERQRAYVTRVRGHAEGLAEGRCPPQLLHQLAQAYFDEPDDNGAAVDPLGQLRERLDDDEALVQAALAGFRELLARDDLPDLAGTAQLHEAGRFSWFDLPFLAGLAEEERAGSDPLELLDEEGLRRALGYYFVSGPYAQRFAGWGRSDDKSRPGWYRRALESNPEAVADAMVAVHLARVRMKAEPDRHLHKMSQDPAYARVAPLAVKRMFGVFPSRCTESQVETLRLVIWVALDPRNMAPSELASLVRRRLERRGMDVAQRVQWLCAGLFVARSECLPQLRAYLADGRVRRAYHIVDFFMSFDHQLRGALSLGDWEPAELAVFLRTAGGRLRRYEPPEGVGMLSDEQLAQFRAEPLLRRFIDALAKRADDLAAAALASLAGDPDLAAWRAELIRAREEQAEKLRVAKHVPPTVLQIQETLRGGSPSCAADVVALVLDKLERLGQRIRDGSTNDWKQYWHLDETPRHALKPQYETDCRDALLSDLRLLLEPYGIDAHREGQYAEDKRADIRVALGSGTAIPVEIKKNFDTDVWRAVNEQLIPKYTRAPESEGYGIYLVFWFGRDHMKVVPPSGNLPRTPTELAERLEEQLTPEQRAKIGVVVIDVSPSGKYAAEDS